MLWAANVGDNQIFSAPGLMPIDASPLKPGDDPKPDTYPMEQWTAQMNQYAKSIDTHMPTSMVAIANLFLRNSHQLGLQAAQTLNRKVRDQIFNAAISGWTVADGAQTGVTTLRGKRLNGFTRARHPALAAKFDLVSSSNPLSITIFDTTPAAVVRSVTGFTADNPGDEVGPGTLTLATAVTVLDRAYVVSSDATQTVWVGGGNKVDDIGSTDLPTLGSIRTAVSNFRQQNVPEHPDGNFHSHLDPTSESLIFQDSEFQRLLTALPDSYFYSQFAIGKLLGTVFFRNTENPVPETVIGGGAAGATPAFDLRDPFPGEMWNNGSSTTGVKIHRILFTAQGGVMEYYNDMSQLITEAGLNGKLAEPNVVNNGIEVFSDRIQLVIRAPQNRLQDLVSVSWRFMGDWPLRTDAATGNASRYKRFSVVNHGE